VHEAVRPPPSYRLDSDRSTCVQTPPAKVAAACVRPAGEVVLSRVNVRLRRSLHLCVLSVLVACGSPRATRILLPEQPVLEAAELQAGLPIAPGQSIRAERLGATKAVSYHLVQLRPGAGERPHVHVEHDLVVVVIAGNGTQWIAGRPMHLQAGDAAVIPAGTAHLFVNTGDQPAAALVVFSPPHDGSDQVFLDRP
jgi:quercetin dioxygenase-like cupin family protein